MDPLGCDAPAVIPRRPRRRLLKFWRRFAVLVALVGPTTFAAVTVGAPAASAYVGASAASYADYYWNLRNSNYYTGLDDDCADFVSQAIHDPYGGGGFSYVGTRGTSDVNDDHQWWINYSAGHGHGGFNWTYSWVRVIPLWNFLIWDLPGGYSPGYAYGTSTAEYTPDQVVAGDLLFYDWDSNGTYDHVAIQTGIGWDDTNKHYGNYIDQHTNDRKHAFWTLIEYNSQAPTTTIHFMHIFSSNP